MKTPPKLIALFAGAALFLASGLSASTTTPVGYVTLTVNDGADARVGITLNRAPNLSASVSSVSSNTLTTSATVPDVTTDAHFVLVTSGSLAGNWYQVTGSTSSTITVSEDLQSNGLAASDTFQVIPFWTLDTLFPDGGNIPASSNVTAPVAQILLNDVNATGINLSPAASYIYHSGEQGPAGWYDLDNIGGGLADDTIISPESYITIRNESGSFANIVVSGTVPVNPVGTTVVSLSASDQDNQISNPYPAGVQLQNSNLHSSGALSASPNVTSPTDLLLIFEGEPTGKNPSPTKSVIYHSGEQGPAGYYDLDNIGGGLIDTYEIPAGAAIILRKAASIDTATTWTPDTPYTL